MLPGPLYVYNGVGALLAAPCRRAAVLHSGASAGRGKQRPYPWRGDCARPVPTRGGPPDAPPCYIPGTPAGAASSAPTPAEGDCARPVPTRGGPPDAPCYIPARRQGAASSAPTP